ncbi:hypothetical protein [Peribacillus saganii]|nr:hypothetical protein [Peribacillus saganii]
MIQEASAALKDLAATVQHQTDQNSLVQSISETIESLSRVMQLYQEESN